MAHKIALCGEPNTGKSFSRRTIKDGENIFILASSNKATHLKDSKGVPLQPFNVKTNNFDNIDQAMAKNKVTSRYHLVNFWNEKLTPGRFTAENLKGNVEVINSITQLPIWLEFISKHLTWIHTVIIPDFTHFISREISEDSFINRKAGGEAYQRYVELAAKALKNFILGIDNYRHDLVVAMEYHAELNEVTGKYALFMPAGKMLLDKFKAPSYYDIMLFTDVKVPEDEASDDGTNREYRFVTRPTFKYPLARCMNLFEETYIENDLQLVLDKVRAYLGIPLKQVA